MTTPRPMIKGRKRLNRGSTTSAGGPGSDGRGLGGGGGRGGSIGGGGIDGGSSTEMGNGGSVVGGEAD